MIRNALRSALALSLLPFLIAAPAFAHGDNDHAAHEAHENCDETRLGDIVISGAFTRATLPNAPVAGGFLTLTNEGEEDDTLVSASADIARETQIHEMAMEGDVMKMRQLADGIVIPAGETVTLAPGGLHVMFMGLNTALVEGESVPVTLTFERAGTITIDLSVAGAAADGPAGDHAAHEGH